MSNDPLDEIPLMFFVGRIDVPHDSGLQRGFGVFGDFKAAEKHRKDVAAHMQGTFMVFKGVPVTSEEGEAV